MIYSIKGELTHTEQNLAVIECGGVGYACRTTFTTLSQIGQTGETVKLLTYLHVREDAVELFGFYTQSELTCFKMLLSVSGAGPRTALAILSDTTPEKFALSVATGDTKAFTKTKGVGPKLAQRIILELKDKIAKEQLSQESVAVAEFTAVNNSGAVGETISALVVLGYSQTEAASVVSKLDASLSAPELIRKSLQLIGKNK
ncbi:MAG: Holliday junction branch migration protein RuvA [Oscillospiraceae bacterium]|nr:Holliday junction branch migration protein RuvA [Oscillospiraceae bacterium]